MNNNLTELVMILDRSGSMQGLEKDTIGGYNGMLEKQKSGEGDVLVTTILFDDRSEMIHDRINIKEIRPITDKEYYVRGCTALLDAVGDAIKHIESIHKYAREEDKPGKTVFVITTDGYENASKHYGYSDVKKMIEQQKERYGWEFLFLGANIDAVAVAGRVGIAPDRAANYVCDSAGTSLNYECVSEAVCDLRASRPLVGGAWKKKIDKDYKARKR